MPKPVMPKSTTPALPMPSWRSAVLVACALAAAAPALSAQSRDRWEDEERARRQRTERERQQRGRERQTREREFREREQRLEREHQARLRADDERRRELERRRDARTVVVRRQDPWGASYRPRLSLGGGLDVRRFGGEDNRYLGQAGVDFRGRSGFGVRPEVIFGWTDRNLPTATGTGRSRMLGVAASGTYAFLRSSPVRPYALSGIGVFSTRTPDAAPIVGQPQTGFRNDLDLGLTAGTGLEVDFGPARLFTEFRYLLTDDPRPLGFSGVLPLTVGVRF